jgi:hypothetical protein
MAQTYITAIRLSQGKTVRHIIKVWSSQSPTWSATDEGVDLQEMVRRLSPPNVLDAYVQSPKTGRTAKVNVVRPAGHTPYLRTSPDDDPDDNLLHLPQK